MFPSKPKKSVHYTVERGTKPSSSHRHRSSNSRDSGIGSDRATVHDDEGTSSHSHVEDQRYNLSVVQEALDAAYERIKELEASSTSLNLALTESNKENRMLKKEKNGLLKENEDLLHEIELLNQRNQREASPCTAANVKVERKPSPRFEEFERPPPLQAGERRPSFRKPDPPRQLHMDERPLSNHSERRSSSLYERTNLPTVPQAPPNNHPNPFAPRPTQPVVTYAAMPPLSPTVAYAPSNVSYSAQPLYVVAPRAPSSSSSASGSGGKKRGGEPDDGKYHLQPL